ncbi:MAG: fatty acid--CoA ligase [Rhodospirillales bacterium]
MVVNTIEGNPSAYGYPLLIKSLLETGVTLASDQEIVYADRKRMTYGDLRERVARLASRLRSLGVREGDTVAVMDWDSHRYLECYFAVPMLGAVLHTVNVRLSPEQILYTINHARDDVILVNSEFLPLLAELRDRIEPVKTFILLDDTGRPPETSLVIDGEYEDLLRSGDPEFEFPELSEDTRATTFYTTGTTGLPKGVYFSHRQLVLHTFGARAALGGSGQGRFNGDDVYMPITPMFHVHAWAFPYHATTLGVKQVYPGRYVPEVLLELIEREGVTFSHCVPAILQMLLASPKSKEVDLSRWKVVIGGSAMPQALARQAVDRGIDAFTAYGMSETCPLLTLAQLKPHMRAWDVATQVEVRCMTGRPLPLVQLRIVDAAMNDVAHDGKSQGEVVVRAPWLTQGYLRDPRNSATLWEGGWLHTGDIGVINEDGYLKITDRIKDVIKSGGEWISSLEIEDLLMQHAKVAEAAVIGVPDQRWGERPWAYVVLRSGEPADGAEAELKRHLKSFADRGILSPYAVPDHLELVDALPRTSVGKLNKNALRAMNAAQNESQTKEMAPQT